MKTLAIPWEGAAKQSGRLAEERFEARFVRRLHVGILLGDRAVLHALEEDVVHRLHTFFLSRLHDRVEHLGVSLADHVREPRRSEQDFIAGNTALAAESGQQQL